MIRKLSILTCLLTLSVGGVLSQPKIKLIPGTTLDLGDQYQGQKAEKIVFVKNVGTDTLNISEVKAQCGCTATMMTERKIAPSDSGKLQITFNTQSYNGKVSKQVYVSSNDTSQPKLTIQFSANVIPIINLNPPSFAFDNAKLDSTYTKTIVISNPSAKDPIKILSVQTKFEYAKVTLMKNQLMPGEQTQLQAVLHPTKAGTYNGSIELATDHPLQPKLEVKIFAWVNRK